MTNSSSKRLSNNKSKSEKIIDSPTVSDKGNDAKTEIIDVSVITSESSKAKSLNSPKNKSILTNTVKSNNSKSFKENGSNKNGSNKNGSYNYQFKKVSPSNSGIALGMIETRGMVPAIEAADAMTKAAEVSLISRDFVGGGYVTVMVRGETGAVNASVRAGADACERVGDGLVAAHIIARPHKEIEPVLKASGRLRGG